MRRIRVVVTSLVAVVLLAGCEQGGGHAQTTRARVGPDSNLSASPAIEADGQPRPPAIRKPRGNTEGGATFADRVMSTDPQRRYLRDAFVRDERLLGVIVAPEMTPGQVDDVLRSWLTAMRKIFPGRLEAVAYDESGDQLHRLVWNPDRPEIEGGPRRHTAP